MGCAVSDLSKIMRVRCPDDGKTEGLHLAAVGETVTPGCGDG